MYRGRFGIVAALRRALGRSRMEVDRGTRAGPVWRDLKGAYERHVSRLTSTLPRDEAMELAIGGGFDEAGQIESAIVRHYGLGVEDYLIDVGCGSGRLAKPLAQYLRGRYLGTDLVEDLLTHARTLVSRPTWRFQQVDYLTIPEADGVADMVCFFSVFTHLLHEQSYIYLQEAKRVLKPGGRVIFSTLEFSEPSHWRTFSETVKATAAGADAPLNVFLDRQSVVVWADHLGLIVEDLRGAGDMIVPEGHLGQAICVLRKPPENGHGAGQN